MKKKQLFFLLAMLFSVTSFSYRFVCNGLLASGEARSDECGICDEEHAARWINPEISVVIDDTILPATINKEDWHSAVKNSLAAWDNISGSSLRFKSKYKKSSRDFGANDDLHEIFWITDKNEWRKLVGSGEFGTLGATLPRYVCGGDLGANRVIFDADLVLNGLSHINWQMECNDEDCISVQTTLVHELGHFFGLDHPCLMCSNSIMSARAGYDLIYPVIDDMEGLRALYPNGTTGGFGSPCGNNEDCDSENRCVYERPYRYCTKACENNSECNVGASCKGNEGKKVCSVKYHDDGRLRNEGQNCMRTRCAEDLVCAGAEEPNFYCYKPCTTIADCKENQDCIQLGDDSSICITIKKLSERCDHRNLCEENLYCVFDRIKSGACRIPCASTDDADSGCPGDEVCEILEGIEICIPPDDLMLSESMDRFTADALASKNQDKKDTEIGSCQSVNNTDASMMILMFALFIWRSRRPYSLPSP